MMDDRPITLLRGGVVRLCGAVGTADVLEGHSFMAFRLASQLDAAEQALREAEGRLVEVLHGLVHTEPDKGERRRLLALKRSVFNGRWSDASLVAQLQARLSTNASLRAAVNHCLEILSCASSVRSPDAWQAVEFELCRRLRRVWADDERFRSSVLFSQPLVYRAAQDWFRVPIGACADAEWRRLRLTLWAYRYRMVTKPTPFAMFTSTAAWRTADSATTSDLLQVNTSPVATYNLRPTLINRIVQDLYKDTRAFGALPLTLNASITVQLDCIQWVHVITPQQAAAGSLGLQESLRTANRNALLEAVIELCQSAGQSLSAARIATHLRLAGLKIQADAAVERLRTLYEAGFFRPAIGGASGELPLDSLRLIDPELRGIEPVLQAESVFVRLDEELALLSQQDALAQASTLSRVDAILASVNIGTADALPAATRQGVVSQDSFQAREIYTWSGATWCASGLAALTRAVPLFDSEAQYRGLMHRLLNNVGRGGDGIPILRAYEIFSTSLRRESALLAGSATASDCADMVASSLGLGLEQRKLQHRLADALQQRIGSTRGGSVAIPTDFLEALGSAFEPGLRRGVPLGAGFLGQVASEHDDDPLFILNRIVPGFGALIARLLPDPNIRSLLGAYSSPPVPGLEGDLVSLIGTFGFGPQPRHSVTQKCLVLPGEVASDPDAEVISWSDVVVRKCDADRHELGLWCRGTDRRLVPVRAGTLAPRMLPPFVRFVMAFGPAFAIDFPVTRLLEDVSPADPEQIRHYPRLICGRVAFARETWCVPCAPVKDLFPPDRDRDGADSYRAVRRWARELGLPRRVFIVAQRVDELIVGQSPASFRAVRRPIYVDWDDLVGQQLFLRMLRRSARVLTITEALPQPHDSVLKNNESRSVVGEFLLETVG